MMLELAKAGLDIAIVVTNAEQMVTFYRDTLGLTYQRSRETGPGGTMHLLECGDSLLKLLDPPEHPPNQHSRGGTRAQTGLRYLTIWVHNIEELVERCKAADCHFLVPLRESTGSGRYCQLEDPEGNVVQLQQPS